MLRQASITLAIVSALLPVTWAWTQVRAFAAAPDVRLCGMALVNVFTTAALAAVLLSMAAAVTGVVAWRRVGATLGFKRGAELVSLVLPGFAAAALLLSGVFP